MRRSPFPLAVISTATIVMLTLFSTLSSAQALTPYRGSAGTVPGTIQAADFDNGGEGIAYHDTTAGNAGGMYRSTRVDIGSSSEGGYTLGWIDPGEWLNYTVNVTASGTYNVQIRVAAPQNGSLHIGFNQSPGSWTAVSIPASGGWQSWSTVTVPLTLTAGVQQMTLAFDSGWYNVSYVTVASGSGSSSVSPTSSPYNGAPAAVPGQIRVADFDNGGEGVAYHDSSPGNAGGQYRQTDVDIASSSEGGTTVGWIDAGEWLNYTVNVTGTGNYTAQIRVASPWGGTLHIGFNRSTGSWTSVSVPATGGWQAWTSVNVPMTLTAGIQQMTLMFDSGWYNVSSVNIAASSGGGGGGGGGGGSGGSGSGRLRMMTWNIHQGFDPSHNYVL